MEYQIKTVLADTIKMAADDYVFIDPVCEFFGIQKRNQIDRLKNDRICQNDMQKIACQAVFGDKKKRVSVGRRGFLRWIQIINPAIVRSDLQELFIEYQAAVFDFFYNGMELNNAQLEDIRSYAININTALGLRKQINDYIAEQNNHRNLCLQNSPREWAQIKRSLVQEKSLPDVPKQMKSITTELGNDIEQLKKQKDNTKRCIQRNQNVLKYQSYHPKAKENPLPDGYRREKIKVTIRKYEERVAEIEARIIELIDISEG